MLHQRRFPDEGIIFWWLTRHYAATTNVERTIWSVLFVVAADCGVIGTFVGELFFVQHPEDARNRDPGGVRQFLGRESGIFGHDFTNQQKVCVLGMDALGANRRIEAHEHRATARAIQQFGLLGNGHL